MASSALPSTRHRRGRGWCWSRRSWGWRCRGVSWFASWSVSMRLWPRWGWHIVGCSVTLIKSQISLFSYQFMQVKNKAVLGQISDMDIRLLRVFRAVVDCGGMAAAELELNIGTSTVSRHIKDLETRLGLTLCRRGRAGFALTAEGEQIYAQSAQLLSATEAFRSG